MIISLCRKDRCSLHFLFTLSLLIFFSLIGMRHGWATTPEIRAVWMHPEDVFSADPKKGKIEINQFIERMANANFNLILPWVRSEYIAALTDQSYQKSVPIAKWDALGELIKEAHKKGLQVHLWYSFTYYKTLSSPDFNPQHGGNPDWAARQLDELIPDQATSQVAPRAMRNVCPLHPEARAWELRLIEKVFERYPLLTGIHIEEPGYSGKNNCVCKLCLKLFRSFYGYEETTVKAVNGTQAEDLKCLGTTAFIKQLHTWARQHKLILSTNGSYSWQADRRIGRDWLHWSRLGWLDFYAPQIYTNNMDKFRSLVQRTITDLKKYCPVAVGLALQWSPKRKTNSVETIINQIDTSRQLGAKGFIFFTGQALSPECLTALKHGPFKEPAALPQMENARMDSK